MTENREIEIGEEFDAVIVHPNTGPEDTRDPVTKVDGKTTFVRFPDRDPGDLKLGDVVRCRMADKRSNNNLAVAIEEPNNGS